ncbi:NAD(P)-dependent oxidoreductase [Nocardioides litoris]|uniref:NAD(P)-dependent oxidoreductase n=1 Tax=Nocardioides litoris TaxID=1926648 RepID=UPI001B879587|nr:NAD(P)-dependent oxidoreductase [Nocardioides litoris]
MTSTDTDPVPSASSAPPCVGVVGVGAMGGPMAVRMHRAGLAVRAVDVADERVAAVRADGIEAGTDLDLLAGCDVVVAVVATGDQLLALLDAAVVRRGALRGAVLVVASTVGPAVVRDAAARAAEHGLAVVDCPVTGGVPGAEAGTLTLLVSGAADDVERARPALEPAGTLHVVGPHPGDGQSLKLVNQMLASVHLAAAGEALAFAERLGLDLDVVTGLLPTGAAASWMLADRGPRMALPAADRPTRTRLSVFVKDSGLVAGTAAETGAHAPLTTAARAAWLRAAELGLDDGDDSGVVDVFRAGG